MSNFGDVKSASGLQKLNAHLEDRSYVEGFVPSGADVALAAAAGKEPDSAKYPHAARWVRMLDGTLFFGGGGPQYIRVLKSSYVTE